MATSLGSRSLRSSPRTGGLATATSLAKSSRHFAHFRAVGNHRPTRQGESAVVSLDLGPLVGAQPCPCGAAPGCPNAWPASDRPPLRRRRRGAAFAAGLAGAGFAGGFSAGAFSAGGFSAGAFSGGPFPQERSWRARSAWASRVRRPSAPGPWPIGPTAPSGPTPGRQPGPIRRDAKGRDSDLGQTWGTSSHVPTPNGLENSRTLYRLPAIRGGCQAVSAARRAPAAGFDTPHHLRV